MVVPRTVVGMTLGRAVTPGRQKEISGGMPTQAAKPMLMGISDARISARAMGATST